MLMVDGMTVGCCASRINAMAELATLIKVMAEKEMIDKQDALFLVDAAFMSEEELKQKADEAKKNMKKETNAELKKLLQEMLNDLSGED